MSNTNVYYRYEDGSENIIIVQKPMEACIALRVVSGIQSKLVLL